MQKIRLISIAVALIVAFLSGACGLGGPAETTPEAEGTITVVVNTETPEPKKTPTVEPEDVILIAPPESDDELAIELEDTLEALSVQANLRWKKVESIDDFTIHDSLRIVVALAPDPGLKRLAEQAPHAQFLGVGIEGLEIHDNVSRITTEGMRPDVQGYLAGYVAAMIAPDWRAGVISHTGNPNGRAAGSGFMQGARYFCGQCRPSFPPYTSYPTALNLESPGTPWESGIGDLLQKAVKVVYIYPEIDNPELREYLALEAVAMIGGDGHIEGEIQDYWVASIRTDPSQALTEIWESLLGGEGGISLPMPLIFEDINRAWLSEGKERLAMATIQDIYDGFLDTGIDPLTGELR
jgi:hypothetical protein